MNKPTSKENNIAVESSDWGAVMRARKNGVTWDELRTRTGYPALGMAIKSGSATAVQMLLSSGAPIETEILPNGDKFSPLWSAIEQRNPDMLDYLLQAGCDPDEAHENFGDPLRYVSREKMAEETIILCRHGSKPNIKEKPNALWIWIENLSPIQVGNSNNWEIPDHKPLLALLSCGARVTPGLEIPFAIQRWTRVPLTDQSKSNVEMIISIMERGVLDWSIGTTFESSHKQHLI